MAESGKAPRRSANRLHCAIYTRKSSEEGLEQAFNSLDAQREACAAFILSQKHEGWMVLPTQYDDGGFSGGTMDRPALQRLLSDIGAGKVDVVVVYKIDRLTRSLFDFAKIVEAFDAKGVSFVSITQQFNTSTSMGRLTLNVLLSFAQFERELAGERIRDKIAASKKKGMWMGGLPSLGYDVQNRKLIVNEEEARTVLPGPRTRAQRSASAQRTYRWRRSPRRGSAETSSRFAMVASTVAPYISRRSTGPLQNQASEARHESGMRPKVGFPYSSAGLDLAVHDQSSAALPYYAISSAKTFRTPRGAIAGWSLAEPPAPHQAGSAKAASSI
jgi:DNA invertase Pin-like site-specific DNA recombinase